MRQEPCTQKKGHYHLWFLFTFLFVLASCAAGSYGRLQWSDEALDLFETITIKDNHTYYFFGPEAEPVAILAVDNKYVLAPSLWNQIDLTPDILTSWMERIDNNHRLLRERYLGAEIMDEEGNRIGYWYSYIDWTVIRKGEENEIVIFSPDSTRLFRDFQHRDQSPGVK